MNLLNDNQDQQSTMVAAALTEGPTGHPDGRDCAHGGGAGGGDTDSAARERYDLRVLQALRRIIRSIDLHSRKLYSQHEITGPQLVCLLAVQQLQPVTLSGIARQVHLSSSTVLGILDRLEAKGLVHRQRDAHDRRLVRAFLTEKGEQITSRAPSPLQERLATAMARLPEAEQAAISKSLDRIANMM